MSTSLSSLVNNLSEGLYNDKCKDCKSCLEHISAKDNQLILKCLKCNRFAITYQFCDKDINKCCLMLKKVFIRMNI